MLRLACLLFLLLTGFSYAEENKQFEEPSIDKLVQWVPEQIPRTVSFYFDTDGDGVIDIIIAYFLIEAYACFEECKIELREFNDHWILVSSIGSNPYSYYIIKKWSMWKNTEQEDWRSVEKTSGSVHKYKSHKEWYEKRFLKIYPEKGK